MSCLDRFTNTVSAGIFIASSWISIGISAWQFQNGDGGDTIYNQDGSTINWSKDVCNASPYEYIRPFQLKIDNCDGCSLVYCGNSVGNTGYRLAVAIVTFILAVLMLLKIFEDKELIHYFTLLTIMIMWFSVFVADSAQLSNASEACAQNDFFKEGSTCQNAKYGITIAVDIAITIVAFVVWYSLCVVVRGGVGNVGGNRASAAESPVANKPNPAATPAASNQSGGGFSWLSGSNA